MARLGLGVAFMVELEKVNHYIVILLLLILLGALIAIKKMLLKNLVRSRVEVEKSSTIGREEIYEDYIETVRSPQATLAVLADGLGKNEAGKIASISAVKTFTKLFLQQWSEEKIEYFFKRAFSMANNEIIKRVDNYGGGTSVVSAIIKEDLLYYGLVGNVMISVYRKGELFRLSEGHTLNVVAKREFYKGKITKEHALLALKEKKLLKYLGQETLTDIEIIEEPVTLQKGDIVLLMNKGIYDGLSWIQLEKILRKNRTIKDLSKEIIESIKEEEKSTENNGSIILMKYM